MNREEHDRLALDKHRAWGGKIEVTTSVPVDTAEDLALAYTPGVAAACLEIERNPEASYELTRRHNLCLVVTDGTAVLGLGDIGPEAAMPVMEGKCALFKRFGDVDAFPLCLKTKSVDEIVDTIYWLSGSFAGINLEDIAAPRCFEIERRLKERCDIPIFHDDQHGTAIVSLAALLNALKVVSKSLSEVKIVISGAGAAGISIAKLLLAAGAKHLILCDRRGIIAEDEEQADASKAEIARLTNQDCLHGTLQDAIRGADVFIGVSAPGLLSTADVATMAEDAIVFACANPVPEIYPDDALAGGARIVATGRSDFPNQINNVLAFPGIFRGCFDVRASDINEAMNVAAAKALAEIITVEELSETCILPEAFDPRVKTAVAAAVRAAAVASGIARKPCEAGTQAAVEEV
ncbi:MAG: NADP-dependent malic enzyme [Eubacteriales bacterium]|nr:NADP-dependent malic enzyme [Eubacteriales bacterium]